ncbi:MAG TPA: TIGR02300 family protein [Croceibacterium sp.]|nr:TIGR02300 family protein [Xanthobacteraceae bacterium]HEU4650368.1 TIGR02300 family protein [Croceibacterium sp.]
MAKPELGTKRLCGNCGAKFYDLSKDPIICPKCHTVLELAAVSARSRPDSAAARAAAPVPEEETVVPETAEAEFVSLEDADAEAQGKKTADGEAVEGAEDEVELEDEGLDDAAFIEEQEEGDDDVTDIIGDVDDEEET